MRYSSSLYMFAIMPPPELSAKIHSKRLEFHERRHFSKALNPPVHITIYDPFHIPEEYTPIFEKCIPHIQEWAALQPSFQVELRNYGFFDNLKRPVVFMDVAKSKQLKNFHDGFIKELPKYMPMSDGTHLYKPRITIGHRDVTPAAFPSIRGHYSNDTFLESFNCSSFHLWKHDSTNWQILHSYELGVGIEQLALF